MRINQLFSSIALASAILATAASLPLAGQPATAEPEVEAQLAAEAWLSHVDAGELRKCWEDASESFRHAVSAEEWEQALLQARGPLGPVVERSHREAQRATDLPGVPAGEYVMLDFATTFRAGDANERIVMHLEADGEWRTVGYFVLP